MKFFPVIASSAASEFSWCARAATK